MGYISKGLQIVSFEKELAKLEKDSKGYFGEEYYSLIYSKQSTRNDKKMCMWQKGDPLFLHTHHKKHIWKREQYVIYLMYH